MGLILLPRYNPGDIIPSGWSRDISDNFGLVDSRTGGDPGLVDFFLASATATTGVWRYLRTADYRATTIPDSAMINQKANAFTQQVPTFGSLLQVNRTGLFEVYPASDATAPLVPNVQWYVINIGDAGQPNAYAMQMAFHIANQSELYYRLIIAGSPTAWARLWHSANAGGAIPSPTTINSTLTVNNSSTFNLEATFTRAAVGQPNIGLLFLGNSGAVYISHDGSNIVLGGRNVSMTNALAVAGGGSYGNNLSVGGDIYASRANISQPHTGYIFFGNTAGQYLGYDGTNLVANGNKIWHSGNDGHGSGLDADTLDGRHASEFALAGGSAGPHTHPGSDIIDGTLTDLDFQLAFRNGPASTPSLRTLGTGSSEAAAGNHTHGGGGGPSEVPSGLMAYYEGSSQPTGWTWVSSTYQGRFLVSAGGSFTHNGTGGTLTHNHGLSLSHSGGSVGDNSTSIAGPFNVVTPGTNASQVGHGHGFTQPGAHTQSTPNADHLPPYIGVNMLRKS